MKGDTYKVLKIPGSGVRYLDPDWARDFTLLNLSFLISEMWRIPLTSVAQLVGHRTAEQRVASLIPSLGFGVQSPFLGVYESQLIGVSLSH